MEDIFIQIGCLQKGPYEISQLKELKLLNDTLVWYKDLNDFTLVSQIPELQDCIYTRSKSKRIRSRKRINLKR